MKTELTLLGTGGGPTPKRNRAAPAQAITVGDATYIIDCGNGVGRQLVKAGIDLGTLRGVFITHHHSDHNADTGTLLQLAWSSHLQSVVEVFGPPPMSAMMQHFFDYSRTDVSTRVLDEGRPNLSELVRTHDVIQPGLVYEDDRVRVTCAEVNHPPMTAYAYRIETDDRAIVISGDTAPSDELIRLAAGADVLVHEVMHSPSLGPLLSRTNGSRLREHLLSSHTDYSDVGAIATKAGVETLVLSHFVPGDAAITDEIWTDEAAKTFTGNIIAGRDLMTI